MNFCGHVLWKRRVIGAAWAFAMAGKPPSAAPAPAAARKRRRDGWRVTDFESELLDMTISLGGG